jgi:uncharacterized repeat protein (TIGR02543 family)
MKYMKGIATLLSGLLLISILACEPPIGKTQTYTVTYDANQATGGEAAIDNNVYEAGQNFTLAANTGDLVRTGFTFTGWNTLPNGTGTHYGTGAILAMPSENLTLYAEWSEYSFTVTYSSDDGSTIYTTQTVNSPAVTVGTLSVAPMQSGLFFVGWFTAPAGAGSPFTADTPVTSDITVYAAWSAVPVYTVTFDTDDGSAVASQNIPENGLVTQPADPVNAGYSFGGWYTDETLTELWDFDTDAITAAITIYAKWNSHNYTVTYYLDNGVTLHTTQNVISPALTVGTLPVAPTEPHYYFAGWFTAPNGGGTVFTAGTPVNGDLTVYAAWSAVPVYPVTFDTNGGSVVDSQNIPENGLVTEPAAPVRTGYSFGGWYADETLIDPWNFGTDSITSATTIHAKWTQISYTLTCHYNNGTGSNPANYTVVTPTFSLTAPTRDGYTFGGWYDNAELTGSAVTDISIGSTGNREYWAKWTPKTYIVTFLSNGGTGSPTTQNFLFGTPAILEANSFTPPAGAEFMGWSTDPASTVVDYNETALFTSGTSDINLHACWGYPVRFDANSGTGVMDSQLVITGASDQLMENNFSRSGYTFAGWATNESGDPVYYNEGSFTMGSAPVDLFAVWDGNVTERIALNTVAHRTVSGNMSESNWQCITSSSDGTQLAVTGLDGFIYTSDDSGETWIERTSAGLRDWVSIDTTSDGTKLLAVDSDGSLFISTDSGVTWTERTCPDSRSPAVTSGNGALWVKLVYGDSIFISSDLGVTWEESTGAGSGSWLSVAISSDGMKISAVDSGGYIYTSVDSGETWEERTSAGSRMWSSISSSSDGSHLAAVVDGGYVYTSADGGATWSVHMNDSYRNWRSIASSDDGSILAAVNEFGLIYISDDGGVSWAGQTEAGYRRWCSVTISSDGSRIAAAVDGGYVYTSDDSGGTWMERTGVGNRRWRSLTSSSEGSTIIAANYGKSLHVSSNSGATWAENLGAGFRYWKSVATSADGLKMVAVVENGYIYTSNDGGLTWTEQTSSGSRNWVSVASSSDGNKLVASVRSGYIYTSADAGVTWMARESAGSRPWQSVASSGDGTQLVAAVSSGYIYTSSDSGATWIAHSEAGYRSWYSIISSNDGVNLYAIVNGGGIYKSSDGGVNWVTCLSAGVRYWHSIATSKYGTSLAAVAYDGSLWISSDSGVTWQECTTTGPRRWISVTMADDSGMIAAVADDAQGVFIWE